MSAFHRVNFSIFIAFFLIILLVGCGYKSDPIYPDKSAQNAQVAKVIEAKG
ncbi:MAG: hypothetical protein E7K04_04960 [Helicobacter sp.]|nr:hypothetical protein [Helicobacter sp.]